MSLVFHCSTIIRGLAKFEKGGRYLKEGVAPKRGFHRGAKLCFSLSLWYFFFRPPNASSESLEENSVCHNRTMLMSQTKTESRCGISILQPSSREHFSQCIHWMSGRKTISRMHNPLEPARLYQTEHILQESPLKCNYKVRRDMFHLTTLDRVLQYPGLKDLCPVNHCSPCAYKKHSFSHSFT